MMGLFTREVETVHWDLATVNPSKDIKKDRGYDVHYFAHVSIVTKSNIILTVTWSYCALQNMIIESETRLRQD